MTDFSKQLAFEAHLTDLERLVNLRAAVSIPGQAAAESFENIVRAKAEALLPWCVMVSESTTIQDIERLVKVRYTLMHGEPFANYTPWNPDRLFDSSRGYSAPLEAILQRKIAGLLEIDPQKMDTDPIVALQRLSVIDRDMNLPLDLYLPSMIEEVVERKVAFLADRMAQPEIAPDDHAVAWGIPSAGAVAPDNLVHASSDEVGFSEVLYEELRGLVAQQVETEEDYGQTFGYGEHVSEDLL